MKSAEEQIVEGLSGYDDEIRTFAGALRDELKRETNPAYELAGYSAQSFNIGYGFTTTSWDCYCAIIVYRKHINISLPSGASLTDPDGLLHGTGARVRHLKVRSLADVQTGAVRKLLRQARAQALVGLGPGAGKPAGITTVIKRGKPK